MKKSPDKIDTNGNYVPPQCLIAAIVLLFP